MQFRVVYEEARFGLWRPAFAAVLFGIGTLLLTAMAFVNDLGIFRALLVGLTVFWLVRAMMASADMFVPRQFRVGELGPIGPRGVLSIFAGEAAHRARCRVPLPIRPAAARTLE